MILSKTFEKTERMDMERQFLMLSLSPDMNIGVTLAFFRQSGNIPC